MSLFWCQASAERVTNVTIDCNVTVNDSAYYDDNNSVTADEDNDTIKRFLHQNVIFIISLAGIVGNCLSALVLRCDVERREAVFMLFMLALADTGYLVCAILFYPLKYVLPDEPYASVKVIVYPLLRTFQAATIWLTVLATVERYVYVTRPFLAQKIFTAISRRLYAVGVFVIAVAFNAPRFAEYCVDRYEDECSHQVHVYFSHKAAFLNSRPYRNFYNFGAYIVLLYVLPLTTLAFMNLRLVRAVKASLHRRSFTGSDAGISGLVGGRDGEGGATAVTSTDDASKQQGGESNATLVLVTIVVVFICCQTTELVIKLLIVTSKAMDINEDLVPDTVYSVNEMLMIVNSSINFVIYMLFRQRFRVILCRLLTCRGASAPKWRPVAVERVPMILGAPVKNKRMARIQNVH